jgi:hypothetical protein
MNIPSQELMQQWVDEIYKQTECDDARDEHIATKAAQWGADQELEACCKWVECEIGHGREWNGKLRAARRPKPPSLKKQAYDALDTYVYGEPDPKDKERTYNTIRRALEALPND